MAEADGTFEFLVALKIRELAFSERVHDDVLS